MKCQIQLVLRIDGDDDKVETIAIFNTKHYKVARAILETINLLCVPTRTEIRDYLEKFEGWQRQIEQRNHQKKHDNE